MFRKYGVDNHSKRPEVIEKLRDPNKDEKDRYYEDIARYTRHSWYNHFGKINPNKYERGKIYVLDHIFSKYEGWLQNIPAEIIGHWTNLQILKRKENLIKCSDCWKTKEDLYEDYNKYQKENL